MYCTNCGSPRADNATVCESCGQPVQRVAAMPQVNNYLIPAVLVTLCCCLPGGVVAIIYAAQVNSKFSAGDVPAAMAASRNAKMWCWISLVAGIVVNVVLIIAGILGSK